MVVTKHRRRGEMSKLSGSPLLANRPRTNHQKHNEETEEIQQGSNQATDPSGP